MTRAQDVDADWVAERVRARFGWAAIARMAGCSEMDLRRLHGATSVDAEWTRRPANPRDVVRAAMLRHGFDRNESLILARLFMANGARCRSQDLAAGLASGEAARQLCAETKRRAWTKGIRFEPGSGGFALAADGLLKMSEMADIKGRT